MRFRDPTQLLPGDAIGRIGDSPVKRLLGLGHNAQVRLQRLEASRVFLLGLLVVYGGRNDHVVAGFPVHRRG